MTRLTKRAYELRLVDIWKTDEETFSVKTCLDLEIECIYNSLKNHDDDDHYMDRLRDYMIYQVSPSD
jgi:hypothetical protein